MSLSAADEALLKRYYECKILSLCGRASETSELRRPEQAAATSIRLFQRFYAATSVAARDLDGDTIGRANASARRAGAEALDAYDLFFPGCHYHPLYELPRMAEVAERSWRMSGRPDAKAGAECLGEAA